MTERVRVDSPTEGRNPRTVDIDSVETSSVLELLNDEDARVAAAVRAAIPVLTRLVDVAVERYAAGGTIHYFGAGTSGRLALLDAAELPPTFSADPERVVAHHAGGSAAASRAREATEDDRDSGREAASDVAAGDVAIGIAASGRTPFVAGALEAAHDVGAFTALVSSAPDAPIADLADIHVLTDTGPEAIAGSTRLKAGTAHKLVLNSFSTALMVRLGKTYSNLMVDMRPANAKLAGRVLRIIEEATGVSNEDAAVALAEADDDPRVAIVHLLTGADMDASRAALGTAGGRVKTAIDTTRSGPAGRAHPAPTGLPME